MLRDFTAPDRRRGMSAKGRPERELLPLGGKARSAKGAQIRVAAAAAIALTLAACGVKGPLKLPPSSTPAAEAPASAQPSTDDSASRPGEPPAKKP